MNVSHVAAIGLLLMGVTLSAKPAPGPVRATPKACPADVMAVIAASRENGYQDGWLEGRASVDGPRLPQCERALSYSEDRARAASRYEDCIGDLRFATMQSHSYLRVAVQRCIALLPMGK